MLISLVGRAVTQKMKGKQATGGKAACRFIYTKGRGMALAGLRQKGHKSFQFQD